MNKLYYLIILSCITLISCASKSTDTAVLESSVQKEVILKDNSFDDFLEKFSKDSSYQLLRVKFPVVYNYTDEDDETGALSTKQIQKEEWKIIDLADKSSFGEAVEITKEIKNSNTIELLVNGIDTGLSITYCFKRENNMWYLIKIIDQSN